MFAPQTNLLLPQQVFSYLRLGLFNPCLELEQPLFNLYLPHLELE